MAGEYCVVMTTLDDEAGAATLARQVVEARLGACVQILGIRSFFVWEGAVNDAPEFLLLIKTRSSAYVELEAFIRRHHPYAVPEILQTPVTAGYGPYLAWIDEMTGRETA